MRVRGRRASRLGESLAGTLRAAAPTEVCVLDWVVDHAGLSRGDAAALLAGVLNPPIEVADAVLRACTGSSLPALVLALGC